MRNWDFLVNEAYEIEPTKSLLKEKSEAPCQLKKLKRVF